MIQQIYFSKKEHFRPDRILYPATANLAAEPFFQAEFIDQPFSRMEQRRMPYLDGLILSIVERVADIEAFVTWNVRHYRGKTSLMVLTPAEYIEKSKRIFGDMVYYPPRKRGFIIRSVKPPYPEPGQ